MFGKHLKIVEQIAIVLVIAVLVPMTIMGLIINNVNQHSIRLRLRESAVLIANMVSDEIDFYNRNIVSNLEHIIFSLEYFKTENGKKSYLQSVVNTLPDCEKLEIGNEDTLKELQLQNKPQKKAVIPAKISENQYLIAIFRTDSFKNELFKSLDGDKRQVYILSSEGDLIAEHNYTEETYNKTISLLPKKLRKDKPIVFGDVKNQPLVYVSKDNPKITIIVNTTEKVTRKTITDNSLKIILSCLLASFIIISIIGLYTYYLYINIRQLFKGIIALSKGNYERQIRLLTTAFTPHEIIFLAFEFNRMASEIRKSYIQLKKNNVELKQLNEFRSNLIDTVSHELRTPLTSIQGYTSRLMRQDIKIDEETKQKSLRIIKEQSERLKRLIEDLLTIPDIEGMRLRTNTEDVWLPEILEEAKLLIKNKAEKEIIFNLNEDFPLIRGDKDRLLQVFANLLENAAKYASENSKIIVDAVISSDKAKIFVKNDCDVIPPEKLNKLFEKFIRLDDNTTRTTRGTGLGLFIVKGLIEAMEGEIKLHSDENCGFCAEITMNLSNAVEVV